MKRITTYLPDETHKGLKELSLEADTSVAKLIRKAVNAVYGEAIEDIHVMEEEIAHYQAYPESAVDLADYLRK